MYIGAYVHNDHQELPFGVFVARSLVRGDVDVRRLLLPSGARPWDLLVRDHTLYILTDTSSPAGYTIQVLETQDLIDVTPELSVELPTFARSFEFLDDDFYFGLGAEWNLAGGSDAEDPKLSACVGWIVRARAVNGQATSHP